MVPLFNVVFLTRLEVFSMSSPVERSKKRNTDQDFGSKKKPFTMIPNVQTTKSKLLTRSRSSNSSYSMAVDI